MRAFAVNDVGVYLVHLGMQVNVAVDVPMRCWAKVNLDASLPDGAWYDVDLGTNDRLFADFRAITASRTAERRFYELGNQEHGEGGRFASKDGGRTNERYYISQDGAKHIVHDRKWEEKGDPYTREFGTAKEAKAKLAELDKKYGKGKPEPPPKPDKPAGETKEPAGPRTEADQARSDALRAARAGEPMPRHPWRGKAGPPLTAEEKAAKEADRNFGKASSALNRAATARNEAEEAARIARVAAELRKNPPRLVKAAPLTPEEKAAAALTPAERTRAATTWPVTTRPYVKVDKETGALLPKSIAEIVAINDRRVKAAMKKEGVTFQKVGRKGGVYTRNPVATVTEGQLERIQKAAGVKQIPVAATVEREALQDARAERHSQRLREEETARSAARTVIAQRAQRAAAAKTRRGKKD